MTTDDVRIAWLSIASVSDVEFAADISYFILSRETFVWCFPCQNDCFVHDNDGRKTDCSETSFYSSPVEQRLRNAWFLRECYEEISCYLDALSFALRIFRDDTKGPSILIL